MTCENGIGECGEEARLQLRSKPASAPQVSHALPFRERTLTVSKGSERSFLRAHVFRRVVGVSGQRKANRQDIAKGVADRLIVEQWQRLRSLAPIGRRAPQAGDPRAKQTIATCRW